MRSILGLIAIIGLTACTPPVPDSSEGVGFQSYSDYQKQQLLAAQTARPAPPAATAQTAPPAAETGQVPVKPGSAAISDEQDFQAVSTRESIESDAARIEANRAVYEIVEPKDLPVRPGGGTLDLIVAYALATTNPVGQPLYNRSGLAAGSRFERNCAKYTSSDLAQEAFLNRGGPKRDPMGLDPDGDGFACYWDPSPFRAARQSVSVASTAPADPAALLPATE